MIQLQSLHIKTKFKNIEDLNVDFEKSQGITLLIGNNGSGKSNLIEALSSVFAGLYDNEFNPTFSYEIRYLKDDSPITITYDHLKSKNNYSFTVPNPNDYLPSQIISVYSGEESRMWKRYYFEFYDKFMKDVLSSKKRYSEKQKMEFINKYYWNIALLTMFLSDLDTSDILGERKIDKILFHFERFNIDNIEEYTKKNPNEVTQFADLIYKITTGKQNSIVREINYDSFKSFVLDTHLEFFKKLSISLLPKEPRWKLISKMELILDNGVNTEELSEGEKKQILIKFITRIFSDENSILLLDEPDSHIHINNKEKIKHLLLDSTQDNKPYVQSVLTTHSPTLTSCFENENVYMLTKEEGKIKIIDSTIQEIINHLTAEYWNPQEQNIFLSTSKPIILFVEGIHDKEHIKKAFTILKSEYEDLNFEIFQMNSANNIPPMMTGLRTSELEYNKLFIGIFDDDKVGQTENSLTTCSYPKEENKKRHVQGYYSIVYPRQEGYKDGNLTVENLFDSSHLETSYSEALTHFVGRFKGKSLDKINDEIKDKAKSVLVDKVNALTDKEDFKNFRLLFNKIREIKDHYGKLKEVPPTSPKEVPSIPSTEVPLIGFVGTINIKDRVLDTGIIEEELLFGLPLQITELYNKYRKAILELDKEIIIYPMKSYIAFKIGRNNIVDIGLQRFSIKIWINLRKGKLRDPQKIARDASIKGHLGNGDYEITVKNENNFEYIIGLIKQAIPRSKALF